MTDMNYQSEDGKKPYRLKRVMKPLPSQARKSAPESGSPSTSKSEASSTATAKTPKFRDITEDDDGYHPYADIPDDRPLFEEDPWR